jgi:hypothetical protein
MDTEDLNIQASLSFSIFHFVFIIAASVDRLAHGLADLQMSK